MPSAHNLVLCVDIENTLKILKNTQKYSYPMWGVTFLH